VARPAAGEERRDGCTPGEDTDEEANMRILLTLFVAALAATTFYAADAEAKRFGGGGSFGKQYSTFSRQPSTPQKTPNAAAQAPATAAQGRPSGASRWLGPLAGLAAGGLLASLLFGDAFEGLQIMDILLFAALIFGGLMLFRAWRGHAAPRPAGAGALGGNGLGFEAASDLAMTGSNGDAASTLGEAPEWFRAESFVDGAKTHFIRLQAAWDKGDFRDIRDYTTPELFAELKREFERLGHSGHYTEVVMLSAELLGTRRERDQLVASIRFSGAIREQQDGNAEDLNEIWHVAHDWDNAQGDWLITGIQQATD
jgi:predicted lipid-binding transport protein (Tim44 family)